MKRKNVLSVLVVLLLTTTSIFTFSWESQATTSSVQSESGRQKESKSVESFKIGELSLAGITLLLDKVQTVEVEEPKYKISDEEKEILYRIVEAECTGQSKESKQNVTSAILNRAENTLFPDTIEKVVFQKVDGYYQFSPVSDNRYYTVEITEQTKEAVDEILQNGIQNELLIDALYFFNKGDIKNKIIKKWIDRKLEYLTEDDSGHSFYKEK